MLKNISKELFITSLIIVYIIFLLFSIPFFESNIYILNTTFLLFFSYVFYLFYGYRSYRLNIVKRQYFYKMVISLLFFYIFFFSTGILVGYEQNVITLSNFIILLFYLLSIILEEFIRYISINRDREKNYLSFTVSVLFAFLFFVPILDNLSLKILSFIVVLFYNLILNYLCYHLGLKFNCFSRIGYEFLFLLFPIFPKINVFFIILFVFISLLLFYRSIKVDFSSLCNKVENKVNHRSCSLGLTLFLVFILVFTIILISGKSSYFMIGIGSNSMSPSIKKGDAIIVKKINNDSILEINDIIVYKYNNTKIVHRIYDIEVNENKVIYITKGDNNNKEDELELDISDIEGIVSLKIPYIAYPAVALKEALYE